MGRRRIPIPSEPGNLADLAREMQLPVVLVDYQVTRRQRIHLVAYPDETPSFSSLRLFEVLQDVLGYGWHQIKLCYTSIDGVAQILHSSIAKPQTIGDIYGESTRTPAQSERDGANR